MSAPVYEIGETETTAEALERLGYGHRSCGNYQRREIYCLATGDVVGQFKVEETNAWIRGGCRSLEAA